jgi:hypothetical protein
LDAAGSCFSDFGGGFFYKNSLAIEPEIGTNHSKIVLISGISCFGLATSLWINDIFLGKH